MVTFVWSAGIKINFTVLTENAKMKFIIKQSWETAHKAKNSRS